LKRSLNGRSGQESFGDAMHIAVSRSKSLTLDENAIQRHIELHSQMDELIAKTIIYMKHQGIVSEDLLQEAWVRMHAKYLVGKVNN
jgi:hypothetical protein